MADLFDAPPATAEEREMEKKLAEMDARRAQKRAMAAAGRGEICQSCKHGAEHVSTTGHRTGFIDCSYHVKWQWLGSTSVCIFVPSRFERGTRAAPQESAPSSVAQKEHDEGLRERADFK